MKLDELRDTVKKGFKTKRICRVMFCKKCSTSKGYCKDHGYECRSKGCYNRVKRLNDKCAICSRKDNKRHLRELNRIQAGTIDIYSYQR